jgi:hypothetical protein
VKRSNYDYVFGVGGEHWDMSHCIEELFYNKYNNNYFYIATERNSLDELNYIKEATWNSPLINIIYDLKDKRALRDTQK